MVGGFMVAALLAVAAYGLAAPDHRLGSALRQTARWSFLLFSLATGGGALATLFGQHFEALAARGRDLGMAFAAAHAVHVALVARLLYIEPTPFPRPELIFFSIGVFWIYLIALLSLSERARGLCGEARCARIRSIGIAYIGLAFFYDFASRTLDGNLRNALHYAPLLTLSVAVPLLRVAAWRQRVRARIVSVSRENRRAGQVPGAARPEPRAS
jgi:hypothetical protein